MKLKIQAYVETPYDVIPHYRIDCIGCFNYRETFFLPFHCNNLNKEFSKQLRAVICQIMQIIGGEHFFLAIMQRTIKPSASSTLPDFLYI